MRLTFSTSWIFRGWITCALVTFYAQDVTSKPGSRSPRDHQRISNTDVISKPVKCDESHYIKDSRCCKKCGPGLRVLTHCTDFHQTKCIKCNRGEYQPGLTEDDRCLQQKFCDQIKGFMERPENPIAEEPCRCLPHLQCYPINCEFCERIPTCSAGYGLEVDPESTNGRKICVACKKGFFSADNNGEQCRPWTSCKSEGRTETHPGSAQADAVCGPHVSGSASSWVIVSVLSVITVLCLLILLLFCYKDKLKLLSVNLRSCVQNLKRTRIQQETLAPLYNSGGPKCAPCETTKLICQAPHNPTDDPPCTFLTSVPEVKVSLPFTADRTETEANMREAVTEDQSEGSGEPEEVSEEEEEEVVSVSPLIVGSCVCVISIREPLEVGENEDCSQAVSPGTLANCSCRGLDGEREGDGEKSESDGPKQKIVLCKSETVAASFVSLSPPLVHTSSGVPPSSPLPELCLPLSQALVPPEFKPHVIDRSLVKQEELYILTSTNSTETSTTSVMSSVSPLMTTSSSSVGDLYLDKPPEASGPERGQGLCWEDSSGNKLSSGDSELDCSPESLHSQLDEPTLTSGQVLGNHNTTFISSGQVMNFSGDVIVVYVSQTSVGSEGTGPDDAFGSPVQEEASEAAPVFRGNPRSRGDSTSHTTVQDETLPVHEMMEERPMGK
ncbi:tumor necrosis factor receptor superfamily member 11A [Solea solea]|uniref:tumor necrosis factor receptor superfamily member 11A n=1 Tax=Solea solea TaxID=90069 RepID=UPI00272D3A6A|nr:tumor necrosis factor receptor superfamily member 11A [Solea solea]